MESEEHLVPFHVTCMTGKKVLVLAPHPDDESIGCGGALALHALSGDPVKVVFLTNGAMGDSSGKRDREEYVSLRKKEALEACAGLGITDTEFWLYEDRRLAGSRGALRQMIDLLESYSPELVYAPSLIEINPDHRAACFLLYDAIRSRDFNFEVAFYEGSQPISANVLVDITSVLDRKIEAIGVYETQLSERPYGELSIALNRFRTLTLPKEITHAEAFSLWSSGLIRKTGLLSLPFLKVERLAPELREAGPLVSIIVRTKDRPNLLSNALRSIKEQTYANLEIVVVNDGGQDVEDLVTALTGNIPVTYLTHDRRKGRSAAANAGLKAAKGLYLNFLDDDDVLYPDHLETLVSCLSATGGDIAYSNVLNVYFKGPPGIPESREREGRLYSRDFDPDLLLFENYMPTMCVLFSRDVLSKIKRFSEDLEVLEVWDFWIRLSRHFWFHHIDKVTAEYRFYCVTDSEASQGRKPLDDRARAAVFDRSIPFLNGKACARFLNEGSRTGHREDVQNREAGLPRAEARLAGFEGVMLTLQKAIRDCQDIHLQKDEARERLQTQCDTLLTMNEDLKRRHAEARAALTRIEGHPLYRVYRRIKGLVFKR